MSLRAAATSDREMVSVHDPSIDVVGSVMLATVPRSNTVNVPSNDSGSRYGSMQDSALVDSLAP